MITVEQIVEAYAKTGLKPLRFTLFDAEENGACAVGALCIAHGVGDPFSLRTQGITEKLELSYATILGVESGFDGMIPPISESEEFREGYRVGQRAWAVMSGAAVEAN